MMLGYKELLQSYENYHSKVNFPSQPEALYAPVSYILSLGGKRLRPVLALLAYQLRKDTDPKAFQAGYAIELFHNFSLVHDDIMDHAPLRRGKETVHHKWDEATAILSGDQMLILAFRAIREASNDLGVLDKFETMATEVCEGQRMDMDFEKQSVVAEEDYIAMIRKKTAVLLGFSLWTGARMTGISNGLCDKLYEYGCQAGIGFQIMDDLLDCYGDEQFGKRIGGDILVQKKTLLHLRCAQESGEEGRKKMLEIISGNSTDDEKIDGILSMYEQYNIRFSVEQTMQSYFQKAERLGEEIASSPEINTQAFDQLRAFVEEIKSRVI